MGPVAGDNQAPTVPPQRVDTISQQICVKLPPMGGPEPDPWHTPTAYIFAARPCAAFWQSSSWWSWGTDAHVGLSPRSAG